MPIHNGTDLGEIGKLYHFNGAENAQIGKVYVNDGTANHLLYTASVIMTNLAGDEPGTCFHAADAAGGRVSHDMLTILANVGHRYFVYWNLRQVGEFDGTPTNELILKPDGTVLASSGGTESKDGMAIVTATGNTLTLNHNCNLKTFEGYSSILYANLYMVVDITQYEEDTGVTYTAESFWEAIGSTAFYGSKEFET